LSHSRAAASVAAWCRRRSNFNVRSSAAPRTRGLMICCASATQSAGEVTTFAGNGGSAITDGIGAEAQFNNPLDIAIDETGNLYVGDNSDKIRIITPSAKVTTIGTYEDPNGGLVEFNGLYGIVVDPNGIIYVSDYANNKIWKIVSIQ